MLVEVLNISTRQTGQIQTIFNLGFPAAVGYSIYDFIEFIRDKQESCGRGRE